jgi:hypothetical protein
VYKVSNDEIILSYNEMHEFESLKQPVTGILLANEITYKRCKIALDCLKQYETWKNRRLVDVLFEQE